MARWRALATALAAAAAVTAGAASAAAYCRSTTCDVPGGFASCDSTPPGCQPLEWKRPCIGWTIQKDGSKKIPFDVIEASLNEAFTSWMQSTCQGGYLPGLEIQDLGAANCNQVEYNSLAGNANVVMFRDQSWPHEGSDHNIALTTVTYDVNTGEIFDADIEVNTSQFEMTWGDAMPVHYDLVSIFTHEAGHFLGFSHSSDPNATMFRHYDEGTTAFRDLDIDDQNAMCAVYPPLAEPVTCNPIPRHGFSPDCAAQQTEGKCSASPGPGSTGGVAGALPALASLLALALRRRCHR